jgi:hypothetical protein
MYACGTEKRSMECHLIRCTHAIPHPMHASIHPSINQSINGRQLSHRLLIRWMDVCMDAWMHRMHAYTSHGVGLPVEKLDLSQKIKQTEWTETLNDRQIDPPGHAYMPCHACNACTRMIVMLLVYDASAHIYIYIYVCMCVCNSMSIYICVCPRRACVCMHVCVCVHVVGTERGRKK